MAARFGAVARWRIYRANGSGNGNGNTGNGGTTGGMR